jgi:hypothetical protein
VRADGKFAAQRRKLLPTFPSAVAGACCFVADGDDEAKGLAG